VENGCRYRPDAQEDYTEGLTYNRLFGERKANKTDILTNKETGKTKRKKSASLQL